MSDLLILILALNVLVWILVFWQKFKLEQSKTKLSSLKKRIDI